VFVVGGATVGGAGDVVTVAGPGTAMEEAVAGAGSADPLAGAVRAGSAGAPAVAGFPPPFSGGPLRRRTTTMTRSRTLDGTVVTGTRGTSAGVGVVAGTCAAPAIAPVAATVAASDVLAARMRLATARRFRLMRHPLVDRAVARA
jgi:hypothetical protein